jgi:hypothetical protein
MLNFISNTFFFFNDLQQVVSCQNLPPTVDAKRFSKIESSSDIEFLQENIDAIIKWCINNRHF